MCVDNIGETIFCNNFYCLFIAKKGANPNENAYMRAFIYRVYVYTRIVKGGNWTWESQ